MLKFSNLTLVTTLFLLSNSSISHAATFSACTPIDELDEKIISCGDNEIFPKVAKACHAELQGKWKLASARLAKNLKGIGVGDSQNESESKAKSALIATVAEVDSLILSMKAQTDLVASYAGEMIDYPESTSEAESPDCFNDAFTDLGKVVWDMDGDIIDARKARAQAVSMAVAAGIKSSSFGKVADQKAAPKSRVPNSSSTDHFNSGVKPGESDISGTKENEAKARAPKSEGKGLTVTKPNSGDDAITGNLFGGKITGEGN